MLAPTEIPRKSASVYLAFWASWIVGGAADRVGVHTAGVASVGKFGRGLVHVVVGTHVARKRRGVRAVGLAIIDERKSVFGVLQRLTLQKGGSGRGDDCD